MFHLGDVFLFPPNPIFSFIRFIYKSERTNLKTNLSPDYICYDPKYYTQPQFQTISITDSFNNTYYCQQFDKFLLLKNIYTEWKTLIIDVKQNVLLLCSLPSIINNNCSSSLLVSCYNSSKCISKYRLQDGNIDCSNASDEDSSVNTCQFNLRNRFKVCN